MKGVKTNMKAMLILVAVVAVAFAAQAETAVETEK